MAEKWTSAPWKVSDASCLCADEITGANGGRDDLMVGTTVGDLVAFVPNHEGRPAAANAQLIAAAPALAETLKPFVADWSEAVRINPEKMERVYRDGDEVSVKVTIGQLKAARSALLLAKGGDSNE